MYYQNRSKVFNDYILYRLKIQYTKVAVGTGICRNSHGKSRRFPYGMGMGMTLRLWEFPHVGICGILWEWGLKFHSNGNPGY